MNTIGRHIAWPTAATRDIEQSFRLLFGEHTPNRNGRHRATA